MNKIKNMEKIVGKNAISKLILLIKNSIPSNIKDGKIKHSVIEGNSNVYAEYTHAEGYNTHAKGMCSHAEGSNTFATAQFTHVEGQAVNTNKEWSHSMGRYNNYNIPSDYAFVIGNGQYLARSNAFRVNFDGQVFGLSAFNSTGADYAEYFEWDDQNENAEDRIGHFVSLVGDKIKIAEPDEDIIGVITGMSSIIGNANEDTWGSMYVRDIFGRFIMEDIEIPSEFGTIVTQNPKLNPSYDARKEYIPRSKRKEWDTVGLLGQIVVIDDGTCVGGGKCTVATGGIATAGNKYRVLKRLDDNHILILANFI